MEKITPQLQLMVCTFGEEGIRRCEAAGWPVVEGVEYLVSWQVPEGMEVPQLPAGLAQRDDVRVFLTRSVGLGLNRGIAQRLVTAPIALISDDDLHYYPEGLRSVIDAFGKYSEPILVFRNDSDRAEKPQPESTFVWPRVPKGYYPTSFNIAFRTETFRGKVSFNPYFGVNGLFTSGEEDMLLADAQRAGLVWRYVPLTICYHPGPTTAFRPDPAYKMIESKGAIFIRLHPATWPLRLLTHLMRQAGRGKKYSSKWSYLKAWLRGIDIARRNHVCALAGWYEGLYRDYISGVSEIGVEREDRR